LLGVFRGRELSSEVWSSCFVAGKNWGGVGRGGGCGVGLLHQDVGYFKTAFYLSFLRKHGRGKFKGGTGKNIVTGIRKELRRDRQTQVLI